MKIFANGKDLLICGNKKNILIGSKITILANKLHIFKRSTLPDPLRPLNCSQKILENYCSYVKTMDFV